MIMARQMPINGLAQLVGEHDTRLCQPPNLANSKLTALAWYHLLRSRKTGEKTSPPQAAGYSSRVYPDLIAAICGELDPNKMKRLWATA